MTPKMAGCANSATLSDPRARIITHRKKGKKMTDFQIYLVVAIGSLALITIIGEIIDRKRWR